MVQRGVVGTDDFAPARARDARAQTQDPRSLGTGSERPQIRKHQLRPAYGSLLGPSDSTGVSSSAHTPLNLYDPPRPRREHPALSRASPPVPAPRLRLPARPAAT